MTQYITEKHMEDAIETLSHLVSYPSYLQEAAPNAPFGQAAVDCLKATLEEFEAAGFSSYFDPEGYYGYAEYGEGDLFAILCHLDVVPPGDESEWATPPFTATVTDTAIIGRGVQDDKGPTVAAFYAFRSLIEQGLVPNKKVRFIFGTDEENLWRCMNKYRQEQPVASMGFAPDSKFPLNYAEKGLMQIFLSDKGVSDFTFEGGTALNVVPDKATYSGAKLDEVIAALDSLGYEYTQTKTSVTALGKAIHSKEAPKGINANTRLAEALYSVYPENKALALMGGVIKGDAQGISAIGEVADEPSGNMTFNVAKVTINEQETKIGIDIRYPVTYEKAVLDQKLLDLAEKFELSYEEFDFIAPLYVPLDSELVQVLLTTYRELTGDMTEPIVSGGATYARTMPNCVAYGAMFKDTVDTMHQLNETWSLAEMRKTMEIYAETIKRLCFDH